MRIAGKIVSQLVMLVTLAAFAISTTGFSFYTHVCSGENIQSGLLVDDECCAEAESEMAEQVESCCAEKAVEKPKQTCNGCSSESESDCCITDISYVKLSENYLVSENHFSSLSCSDIPLILPVIVQEDVDIDEQFALKIEEIPKPRPPLYILYQQVKIDPPLI